MIVPSARLIWLAALAGVPLITLLGMGGNNAILGGAGMFIVIAVAAADALLSRGETKDLRALLPGRINLFKGRSAELEVRFINERPVARLVRLGLNLPPSLKSEQEDINVQIPPHPQQAIIRWPCTPAERGSFEVPSVHLEVSSKLGLWNVRRSDRLNVDIRVYPDLFEERKRVAMIFLHRGASGIHAQRQVGKGREFEKLRDYAHGDPIEDVHWKATAKRGRPVSKVFQVERTQEVYVAIDCSRLTARLSIPPTPPTPGANNTELTPRTTVLDRFLTAGLLLGPRHRTAGRPLRSRHFQR